MKQLTRSFLCSGLVLLIAIAASSQGIAHLFRAGEGRNTLLSPTSQAESSPAPEPNPDSRIRSIDFANFTYPGTRDFAGTPEAVTEEFRLEKGTYGDAKEGLTLSKIVYGDVTGDGLEEALVVLWVHNTGSAAWEHVYIYELKKQRPEFIWGFEGGDRAWGGLRQVYARDGGLVIELWGKETHIGGNMSGTEATALCCPKSYTRTSYRWRGREFRPYGQAEILPNPMLWESCMTCLPDPNM